MVGVVSCKSFKTRIARWLSAFLIYLLLFHGTTFVLDTNKDGLAGDFISSIFEDSRGCLWISTESGLTRWKDHKFTTILSFGLPERLIHEDQKGNVWVGQDPGLFRFQDEKLTAFTTKDGLADNSITAILDDLQGNLWLGTESGVNPFRGGKFTIY